MGSSLRLPGLVDVHVHLREPGQTHKEDFASGTAAALAGGFTTVLAMPNTQPPITTPRVLELARQAAQAGARCDVGIFAGAGPDNASLLPALAAHSCGLKIYLDATFGPLRVNDLPTLVAHFNAWPGPGPIAVHAEENSVPLVLGMVAASGQRVHFCHISRRVELELIARAKERGLPVTCEVSPHHLFLTGEDAARLGAYGQMRPPLQTGDDREGLWELLHYVDCIATDHAPHATHEKALEFELAPFGTTGLETALALVATRIVATGVAGWSRVADWMARGPRAALGLPEVRIEAGGVADLTIVDPAKEWVVASDAFVSKSRNSAFLGAKLTGRARDVLIGGYFALQDGKVVV